MSQAASIVAAVESWLRSPGAKLAPRDEAGYVKLADVFEANPDLGVADTSALAAALRSGGAGTDPAATHGRATDPGAALVFDAAGEGLRLRSLEERTRAAVEMQVQQAASGAMSLLDVLRVPAVDALLRDGGVDDTVEQLAALRSYAAASAVVEVVGSMVTVRHPWPEHAMWWAADGWTTPWAASVQAGSQPHLMAGETFDGFGYAAHGHGEQPAPTFGGEGGFWWSPSAEAWPFQNNMGGCAGAAAAFGDGASAHFAGAARAGAGARATERTRYRDRICAALVNSLENASADVREWMAEDGSIAVTDLLAAKPLIAQKVFNNPAFLLSCVLSSPQARVVVDPGAGTIRLRSPEEQVAAAVEEYIRTKRAGDRLGIAGGSTSATGFCELLAHPSILELLPGMVASSSGESPDDDPEAQKEFLQRAIEQSEVLEVVEDGVELRLPQHSLCELLEAILETELRAQAILETDGEVSLPWFQEQSSVRKLFERCAVRGNRAEVEALRAAAGASARYELSESKMSVRLARRWTARLAGAAADGGRAGDRGDGGASRRLGLHLPSVSAHRSKSPSTRGRTLPSEKDALMLRKLLAFYFEPFNLQHTRVLMDTLESRRRSGRRFVATESMQTYRFSLSELEALPRVGRLVASYDADSHAALYAAALLGHDQALPVKLCQGRGDGSTARGAWASASISVMPTYLPDLRFVETTHPTRPEVLPLVSRGPNMYKPTHGLPANAACVVSYSVSSDLSHSQSPKAQTVLEAVASGSLDPSTSSWEYRRQRILRQLQLYGADVICVQGLQSIGFSERCSETQVAWFSCEDEPTSNHLVHLYRELAKANYAVTFAPTMKLPGSAVVCFGNAVFWKRSRWQMERSWNVANAAVCVELSSRLRGPPLVVCSAKSAAVYARDWGEAVDDEELIETFREVDRELVDAAERTGAKPIWAGDFGCSAKTLLGRLSPGVAAAPAEGGDVHTVSAAPRPWRSACEEVLGADPKVTVMGGDGAPPATDFILHDGGLESVAVLGGFRERRDLIDFLRSGYPSDHVLQMAMFVAKSRNITASGHRSSISGRGGEATRPSGASESGAVDGVDEPAAKAVWRSLFTDEGRQS